MTGLRRWLARASEWWRSRRVESDMAAELESHLAHLIDDHIRRGLAPAEARRAAQLELGGLDQARALARDARGFRVVDAVAHDVRLGLRHLRQTPAFTIAAVLTLALGTGATTAVFAMVDAVLLRPLPYADARRTIAVWEEISALPAGPGVTVEDNTPQRTVLSPASLRDYATRLTSIEHLAGYTSQGRNLTGDGPAERVLTEDVGPAYFKVFTVTPVLGRTFVDEDTDGRRVALISHGLWQRRFGGDPKVVGRALRLDQQPFEIVGVLPPDFIAPSAVEASEAVGVWLPLAFEPDLLTSRHEHIVSAVGRLKAGVPLESARAELASASAAMAAEHADYAKTRGVMDLLRRDQVATVNTLFVVLAAAVGLVVLLACVNVAGLLIVRAMGRQRDVAVRYALGASRGRVLLEHVIQSLLLAVLGSAAGLLLGSWLLNLLIAAAPATLPLVATATLDLRVIGAAGVVTLVTALAFGLWPAWQASRIDPVETLKAHDRPAAGMSLLTRRRGLLTLEVALATIVLVGATLMIRSLIRLQEVDLGFNPSHVVAATIALPPRAYPTPDARLAFFEALDGRLRALPGVESVAYGNRLPLRGNWISGMLIEADTPGGATPAMREAGFQAVSVDYFRTVGMTLRGGRGLAATDRHGADPVAVVNEAFGRILLNGASPIGRRIRRGPSMPAITIVGVVSDIRRTGRADADGRRPADLVPQVYLPAAQTNLYPLPLRDVAIRTAPGAMAQVASALPAIVAALDPDQPVTTARSLEETLALGAAPQRFQTLLFLVFAGIAFALALVGIYGVVAYAVTQRSSEIALRSALGASRARVIGGVVWPATRLVALGVVIGLAGSWLASGLISGLLFELPATEPLTYGVVAAVLITAGTSAAWLAARRAAAIDPIQALR